MHYVAVEAPSSSPSGGGPEAAPIRATTELEAPASEPTFPRAGVPRAVWLVVALHLALLLGYSVMSPIFRAPDEYVHVDLMRHLAATGDYPAYDELFVSAPIFAARDTSPAYVAGTPAVGVGDAVPPAERPSFEDLGPDVATDVVNQMPQHPPLYYGLGAAVLRAGEAVAPGWPWSFDRTVALLRLVDVVLVAAVPLLAWATARRFGCPPRAALTAGVLVLAVPQFTHIGAVVNNDVLLMALAAGLFLLAARILTGDLSRRTAVVAGIVTGLALLTKGFALVLAPWILGAYLLAPGAATQRRLVGTRLAWVAGLATVVGGWWWVRNVVLYDTVQPGLRLRDSVPDFDPSPVFFVTSFIARLSRSFWGDFGWFEVALPAVALTVATLLLVGAVVMAFVRGRVFAVRARLAYLVFPAAALSVLVVTNAYRAYLKTGTPFASQGRYLFPGLVGLVVVAAVGFDQLRRRPVRSLPVVALAGALVMQALAVAAIMGRYWEGPGVGDRIRAMLALSPWPPVLVFMGAVVMLALAAWTVVEVVRFARQPLLPTTVPSTSQVWRGGSGG
jgi:4-amino-4-deoxy-L-arabinose transferase-like glycosyltransferase